MSFAVALVTRSTRQVVAVVTSHEARDPQAAAITLADEALAAEPEVVVQAHEAIWERFWSRSGVDMEDLVLRSMWYRNLYFLRSVIRPGAISPGLFASLVGDGPAWHGDFHTNYNIQSTYWSVYSSNHPELSEPYDRLIVEYLPRARWLCRQLFGFEGGYIPHVLFAYEPPPEACSGPTRRQYIHHVWGWTKRFERNRNCAFCLGMFRYMFNAAIEGAQTLDRDTDLVSQWQRAVTLLPDYPLSDATPPVVVDVEGAPPIAYNISVPATPVFPGDVVTAWSPDAQRELFSRTIDQLQWNGNNAAIMLAVSRARLSMPETPGWLRAELTARLRPNGTLTLNRNEPRYGFNSFGHYTEQFAAAMAINELLLQSVSDVVRVFPAWPLDKPARFSELRAQGGFLVSAACDHGQVGPVLIKSTAGGTLRLFSPWPGIEVVGPAGQARPLTPSGPGIIQLDTQQGQVFTFRAHK